MGNTHLQTIYCSKKFFDYIIQKGNRKNNESCRVAYSVLENIGDIYLDISKEELIRETQSNCYYGHFSSRGNMILHSIESWGGFDKLDLKDISDEVIFWDNTDNNSYRKKYGCLVLSKGSELDLLLDYVRKYKGYCIAPLKGRIDTYVQYFDTWEEVLTNNKGGQRTKYILPLNSIIISDNYMFTNKYQDRKNKSLLEIIKLLVPQKSENDIHVSIFTSNSNAEVSHLTKEEANEVINEIKALNLNPKIKVSIITHRETDPTHDRLILTNYHIINSGKGFSIIDNSGEIKETARGDALSVYHNIDSFEQACYTKKHLYHEMISWFNKIYEKNAAETNESTRNEFFIVGDRVKNRLLR